MPRCCDYLSIIESFESLLHGALNGQLVIHIHCVHMRLSNEVLSIWMLARYLQSHTAKVM